MAVRSGKEYQYDEGYAYAWTSSQAVPAKLLRREKFPTAARLQRRNERRKPIGGRKYAAWANEKPVFGDP
ncbi:hypothetical protein TWF788_006373 [Orbilia oligospora]|uniref:Uncharacterized protein n=1 Tax=Orbilia oligospora TaxID=2813651 RepID=A0A7C8PWA9_ORBOL|nr:hypothetical protein TWF788_006373 [Orbilia oligospora]